MHVPCMVHPRGLVTDGCIAWCVVCGVGWFVFIWGGGCVRPLGRTPHQRSKYHIRPSVEQTRAGAVSRDGRRVPSLFFFLLFVSPVLEKEEGSDLYGLSLVASPSRAKRVH